MPLKMQQNPPSRKFKLGKIDKCLLAQIPCRTGLGLSSSAVVITGVRTLLDKASSGTRDEFRHFSTGC